MRRLWLSVLAFVVFAASCGGGDRPSFDESAAREVDSAEATDSGDPSGDGVTLRIAVPEGWSMDPADAGPASVTNRVVADLLYEGLVSIDPGGEIQPGLADRWFVDEARTTWTFVLGAAVVDGDGEFITARDVKLSLERIAARGPADQTAQALTAVSGWHDRMTGAAGGVAGIAAPDATTLVIRLDHPFEPLLDVLADPAFGVTGVDESGLLRSTGAYRRAEDPTLLTAVDSAAPVATVELVSHDGGPGAAMAAGAADWAVLPVEASSAGLEADIIRQPLDVELAVVARLDDQAARLGVMAALEPLLLAGEVPGLTARAVDAAESPGSAPAAIRVDVPIGPLEPLGEAIAAQLVAGEVLSVSEPLDAAAFAARLADGSAHVFPIVIADAARGATGIVRLASPGGADDVFGPESSTRTELVTAVNAATDPTQRALFVEALERSLIDDGLLLPIGRYEVRLAVGLRLDGLRHRVDGTLDLTDVELAS